MMTRTVFPDMRQQPRNDVELMVARENHDIVPDAIFVLFDMDVLLENFQQPVPEQHLFPEIGGLVTVRVRRIALAADMACTVGTLIERQEKSPFPLQAGRHVHVFQIDGEMHQNPFFESENRVLVLPVETVLFDGVCRVLAGELAFQFHRHDGNAVDEQNDIDALFITRRIMELAGTVQDIAFVSLAGGLVHRGFRFPEYRAEPDALIDKAFSENGQQPFGIGFAAKPFDQPSFAVGAVNPDVAFPFTGLAALDEGQQCGGIQRKFPVKSRRITLEIAAMRAKKGFDILFEPFFPYIEIRHDVSRFGLSALPCFHRRTTGICVPFFSRPIIRFCHIPDEIAASGKTGDCPWNETFRPKVRCKPVSCTAS